MSEYVNKPDAGLKAQEEIKLKVSGHSASADDAVREKIESNNSSNTSGLIANQEDLLERPRELVKSSLNGSNNQPNAALPNSLGSICFEKNSLNGLRRHRVVVGICLSVSLLALGFSSFDLTHLIEKSGKLDRDMHIEIVKKQAELPPAMNYVETYQTGKERETDLLPVTKSSWKGKKFGYVDHDGTVIVPPQFEQGRQFREELAAVMVGEKDDRKWGYIDSTGKWRIKPQFDQAWDFQNGLAVIEKDKRYGIIGPNGNEVYKPELNMIRRVGNNFIGETTRYKEGMLNPEGKWLIPPVYSTIWDFKAVRTFFNYPIVRFSNYNDLDINSKFLRIWKQDFCGVATASGKVVIAPKYEAITSFSGGVAAVSVDGKIGFVDTKGKTLIPPKYDSATPFAEVIAVKTEDNWSFIDKTGLHLKTDAVDGIVTQQNGEWFADGLGAVVVNRKVGYINAHGTLVIKPQFDAGMPFEWGHAAVWDVDRWKFIDKQGNFVPGVESSEYWTDLEGKRRIKIPGPLYPIVQNEDIKTTRKNVDEWLDGNRLHHKGSSRRPR